MDKATFHQNLQTATQMVGELTRQHCFNDLPNEYCYVITPNSRTMDLTDERLIATEKAVLKEWNKHKEVRLTAEKAVELLWHDGMVPVWIDTTVAEVTDKETILELFCSRRLREDKDLMHGPIVPPFHIQVALPPDYQKGVLFDVNWKKHWFLLNRQKS
jgi:hypothetical protein